MGQDMVKRASVPNKRVISLQSSKKWDGNDGPWSSFLVGAGTPPQYANVLIATNANQPWFVVPQGCTSQDPTDCSTTRGGIFDPDKSSSWQPKGNYTLSAEDNLGLDLNGEFGFEDLHLGLPGSDLAVSNLSSQLIAGIGSKDFHVATWGVHPLPTNLSSFNNPVPSWISNLKDAGLVSSLSWAYTAGSYANSLGNKQSLGSLTIGGYDTSLFLNASNTFHLGPTDERDLLVGLQSITVSGASTGKSLLPQPANVLLDAGVPHLWLPVEACQAFADTFGLIWNSTLELYFVNETQHSTLVQQNASVSFTLTNDLSSTANTTIVLPYGAFDLNLTSSYPQISAPTRYFPIRRAANSTQYTLGRTFFQHAYVIADYERRTVSINQALFPDSPSPDVREISPLASAVPGSPSSPPSTTASLPVGAIVGIVMGAVALFTLCCSLLFFRRRRRLRRREAEKPVEDVVPELDEDAKLAAHLDGKPVMRELGASKGEQEVAWEMGSERRAEMDSGLHASEMASREPTARELEGTRFSTRPVELEGSAILTPHTND